MGPSVENAKIGERDEAGRWLPSCLVPLEAPHSDARGSIQAIVNIPTHNVSLIYSKKRTVRSNHYHKTDWHYIYVISGSLDYYYRAHGSGAPVQQFSCKAGDMIWTPPMEDHTTVFLEDTTILALSQNPRDQKAYEADVERVILVHPETLELVA